MNKSNSRVCIFYCNEMHKSKGPWLCPAGLQACPSKSLQQVFFLLPFHLLPMPVFPPGCKRRRNGIFWIQTCEPRCQPVEFEVHNSCLARCQCWPCTYIVGLMADWSAFLCFYFKISTCHQSLESWLAVCLGASSGQSQTWTCLASPAPQAAGLQLLLQQPPWPRCLWEGFLMTWLFWWPKATMRMLQDSTKHQQVYLVQHTECPSWETAHQC